MCRILPAAVRYFERERSRSLPGGRGEKRRSLWRLLSVKAGRKSPNVGEMSSELLKEPGREVNS